MVQLLTSGRDFRNTTKANRDTQKHSFLGKLFITKNTQQEVKHIEENCFSRVPKVKNGSKNIIKYKLISDAGSAQHPSETPATSTTKIRLCYYV